jgi:ATP-dependent exoDNAse (exonuclease V) beta subunit
MGDRPGSLRVEFPDLSDPETILARAVLRYCPGAPVPKGRREAFLEARRPAVLETERCLTYVALTRARDRLILEWPEKALEKDDDPARPLTCAGLLLHEAGLRVAPDAVTVGETRHPATVIVCPETLPVAEPAPLAPAQAHRPGRPAPLSEALRLPWRQPPSAAVTATPLVWRAEPYGPPVPWAAGVEDISARGTALHLAARVFLAEQRGREGALMDATGLATHEVAAIGDQMEALLVWLRGRGYGRVMTELPLQQRHPDGRHVTGIADLLAERAGDLLLIDHKSPGPADPAAAAAAHAGQLLAYAGMLEATFGKPVALVGINWLGAGTLSLAEPVRAAGSLAPAAVTMGR